MPRIVAKLAVVFAAVLVAAVIVPHGGASAQTTRSATWAPYREPRQPAHLIAGATFEQAIMPSSSEAKVEQAQWMTDVPVASDELSCPVVVDQIAGQPVGTSGAPVLVMPYDYDASDSNWHWRVLPADVIWSSYWAGLHESRIGGTFFSDRASGGSFVDVSLGGRASILRYGTEGNGKRPVGWEFQIEGAAFPRLNLPENWDLDATDFRFGVPLVYGRENWQWKFSYYHLSSHMGDELAIRENALAQRINYSRDSLATAISFFPLPAWRWYAETAWAFHDDGGARPWEFQFGVDVAEPGPTGPAGTPFMAFNGHLRQELNYGGNFVAQAGWLWRGPQQKVLRTGVHYMNGKSNQFEFFDRFEHQIGGGVWYDF